MIEITIRIFSYGVRKVMKFVETVSLNFIDKYLPTVFIQPQVRYSIHVIGMYMSFSVEFGSVWTTTCVSMDFYKVHRTKFETTNGRLGLF